MGRRINQFQPSYRLECLRREKPEARRYFVSGVNPTGVRMPEGHDRVTVNGKEFCRSDGPQASNENTLVWARDGAVWIGHESRESYTVGWGYTHDGDFFIPERAILPNGDILLFDEGVITRYISADLATNVEYDCGYPLSGVIDGKPVEWYSDGRLKRHGEDLYTRKAYYLADKVGGEFVRRRIGWQQYCNGQPVDSGDADGRIIAETKAAESAIAANDGAEPPPELLAQVQTLGHMEARRILMTRLGMHHYLKDADVVDMDTDGAIARALVRSNRLGTFLICHDGSTGRQYSLQVDHWTKSCKDASLRLASAASPFGFSSDSELLGNDEWQAES